MPPKKGSVNKSEEVRQLLRKMGPDASPKQVVKQLAARGSSVQAHMVSVLKSRMRTSKSQSASAKAESRVVAPNGSLHDFFAVLDLARKIGVANLREIVNRLPGITVGQPIYAPTACG
jgi:hypothetical protein